MRQTRLPASAALVLVAIVAGAGALSSCSSTSGSSTTSSSASDEPSGQGGGSGGATASKTSGRGEGASHAESSDSARSSSSSTGETTDRSAGSTDTAASGTTGTRASSSTSATLLVFSPYKDTSISMNWNTNVISTAVTGTMASFPGALTGAGASAVTLAFATGECGSETWAGTDGGTLASANVALLSAAGVRYIVSTGGADGVFTCGTDAGMTAFIERWASIGLLGVDFDIEAGQTQADIQAIIDRIQAAHVTNPSLRFSLTLATLATSQSGSSAAASLGAAAQDSLSTYGDLSMAAVSSTFGATWPAFLTVNLMTMDYGNAEAELCVVANGACEMGQSAIQAAYNLHDRWGVPYANVELTPMIGGNDVESEQFTLADVDTMASFALGRGLAGVHYWSFDRDTDCATGAASATCNSLGVGGAGALGFLKRFLGDGLR